MAASHRPSNGHPDWQRLIETLSTKVARYRQDPAFHRSERQTRVSLIDPLLHIVGWDPAEPALVRHEFPTTKGKKADYALFIGDTPIMLGEAKNMSVQDLAKARDQGAGYCRSSAVRFLFVTNGQCWEIYDTYQVSASPPVSQFDMVRDTPDEIIHHVQCLHKERLKKPPPVAVDNWQPPSFSKPTQVQFPDRTRTTATNWKALVVAITRWLVQTKSLTPTNCSILKTPQAESYVVAPTPAHPDGRRFRYPVNVQFPDGRTCSVDAVANAPLNARAVHNLITETGQDPAHFKVWFA